MLEDVHTRKEGTVHVNVAFGLIYSLTRNKRALSISTIEGTLQALFAISVDLTKLSLRKQKFQINKSSAFRKESSKWTPFEVRGLRYKKMLHAQLNTVNDLWIATTYTRTSPAALIWVFANKRPTFVTVLDIKRYQNHIAWEIRPRPTREF